MTKTDFLTQLTPAELEFGYLFPAEIRLLLVFVGEYLFIEFLRAFS
jgi:hypothetical protein